MNYYRSSTHDWSSLIHTWPHPLGKEPKPPKRNYSQKVASSGWPEQLSLHGQNCWWPFLVLLLLCCPKRLMSLFWFFSSSKTNFRDKELKNASKLMKKMGSAASPFKMFVLEYKNQSIEWEVWVIHEFTRVMQAFWRNTRVMCLWYERAGKDEWRNDTF